MATTKSGNTFLKAKNHQKNSRTLFCLFGFGSAMFALLRERKNDFSFEIEGETVEVAYELDENHIVEIAPLRGLNQNALLLSLRSKCE